MRSLVWLICIISMTSCGGGGSSSDQPAPAPVPASPKNPVSPVVPCTQPDCSAWQEATPASVGMDSVKLNAAFDYAFGDGSFTQAAVIIKDNKLIKERYRGILDGELTTVTSSLGLDATITNGIFGNKDKDSLASSWSTAKSFTSVLVGIALEQEFITSLSESASVYITEWAYDERATITLRQLLDMRSGMPTVCFDQTTRSLGTCTTAEGSGGSLVFSNNQMDACLARELAETGVIQPWYSSIKVYQAGAWLYSNCDTMVIGEILYRATGKDLETYADINLFSKLGITAHWWQDNDSTDQVDGNYLAYCCLDMTPRDFAKFGQLLLNNGVWNEEQVLPSSYVDKIKNITADSQVAEYNGAISYGLKFWTIGSITQPDGTIFPDANTIYSTIGFDGQYIMIDFENNMVVTRNSLYQPVLNGSGERKMAITAAGIAQSDFVATLPQGTGVSANSNFSPANFLYRVNQAIQ
jgi:CubicO group peptidase (beta-lactamase class C family)